jgi:hypothetical protein
MLRTQKNPRVIGGSSFSLLCDSPSPTSLLPFVTMRGQIHQLSYRRSLDTPLHFAYIIVVVTSGCRVLVDPRCTHPHIAPVIIPRHEISRPDLGLFSGRPVNLSPTIAYLVKKRCSLFFNTLCGIQIECCTPGLPVLTHGFAILRF